MRLHLRKTARAFFDVPQQTPGRWMVWFRGVTIQSPNMPGTSTGVPPPPFLIAKGDSPPMAIGADVVPAKTISWRRPRDNDDDDCRRDDPEWIVVLTAIGRSSIWPFAGSDFPKNGPSSSRTLVCCTSIPEAAVFRRRNLEPCPFASPRWGGCAASALATDGESNSNRRHVPSPPQPPHPLSTSSHSTRAPLRQPFPTGQTVARARGSYK